jgi:3-dehydroquinate synthase
MKLEVSLGQRTYPILIGENIYASSQALADLAAGRQVAIITDSSVAPLYLAGLQQQLAAHASQLIHVVLPAGEANKTWDSLNLIFEALLSAHLDRKCLLIALGGGVVGDIAGFAAAVYQRGVDFVQIPTTLLSQVDSSVGGKTAINHPLGKNMVGAFHQPLLVLADVMVLRSLPAREVSAGLAEIIKHGAIRSREYLEKVQNQMPQLRALHTDALAGVIAGSCEIKAQVVAADEREANLRAILNFGHTFGHAIEAGLGYGQWLHGEAVGAGMVFAADLSRRLGLLDGADETALKHTIADAGLPVAGPKWPADRYIKLMAVDKKSEQGTPKFVLLDGIGKTRVQRVAEPVLRETLAAHASLEI